MLFDLALPRDTKLVAQDEDGDWFAYNSKEIILDDYGWMDKKIGNNRATFLCTGSPPKDFRREIYLVNWE